jgi:hypothetical protein
VFLADGGGGGTVPTGPTFTGSQNLRIEPSALPQALAAFRDAHDRIDRKVQELGTLQVNNWAQDPVSGETAKIFTDRTNGGGADSAIACLTGYRDQLADAIDSLQKAHDQYLAVEGTNTARWGKYDN